MAGIFGVVSKKNCSEDLWTGTAYLQHRGLGMCGISYLDNNSNGSKLEILTKSGNFQEKFNLTPPADLNIRLGIGVISSDRQPLSELSSSIGLVLGYDGNLENLEYLKDYLLKKGASFSGHNSPEEIYDTALITKIIARKPNFESGVKRLSELIQGDYAILGLTKQGLYASRGWGRKPLVLGKKEDSYAVSSESVSFINTGFEILRDVAPGETVFIDKRGIQTTQKLELDDSQIKYGTFEWIYTADPSSVIDGRVVADVRKKIGSCLARRYPIDSADIVFPFPDSGKFYAIGYSMESGIPYDSPLIKYSSFFRSFLPLNQDERNIRAKLKLNLVPNSIENKKIIGIDDSIVRGTQLRNKINELKKNGAREVHLRIACPPLMQSCIYSKTIKNNNECIARLMDFESIRKQLNVESLGYATIEDLENSIGIPKEKLCLECWAR